MVSVLTVSLACGAEPDLYEPNSGTINDASEKIVRDWGASVKSVKKSMAFSELVSSDDGFVQYRLNSGYSVSYLFSKGRLCASAMIYPYVKGLDTGIKGCQKMGLLEGNVVYKDNHTNTMAMQYCPCDADSTYSAMVFAPMDTDLFDSVFPVQLSSGEATLDMFIATVTGNVSGVERAVEVGFIYGADESLSSGKELSVSTESKGDFTLSMTGLVDHQKYYYRPYAIVNGIQYYGEIKEFTTDKLYYQLDGGRQFEMVVVDGGDMHPFSISQTEIPVSSILSVNGKSIQSIDSDGDCCITMYELQKYFLALNRETGLCFRQPTSEEWQYSASGGTKSQSFLYSGSDNIDDVAWYSDNSEGVSHMPALKKPNELGLFDMSGNFGEVCIEDKDLGDTPWHTDGPICGGCWTDKSSECSVMSTKESPVTGLIPGTTVRENYGFDGRYITIRLAMSRP